VHEGQSCSFSFDFWTKGGELGDRLAAKGSTEMAQKYEQQRMAGGEFVNGITAL
jgi:hypothetical protein